MRFVRVIVGHVGMMYQRKSGIYRYATQGQPGASNIQPATHVGGGVIEDPKDLKLDLE